MAKVLRGQKDDAVKAVRAALEAYESKFLGSQASVYRQNPGSIRVRIVSDRFARMSRSKRHDEAWKFLEEHLDEDHMGEISLLILLDPSELKTSLANMDFENPLPTHL